MQYSNMLPTELIPTAEKIASLIKKSGKILVAAHVRPDGDAVGSVSGLVKSLVKSGKQVEAALVDGVPERFAFVFPEVKLYRQPELVSEHDLIIVLDTGEEGRTGFTFSRNPELTPMINIDHHASNTMFGEVNYVDTRAAAACEIVAGLLDFAGLPIDQDVALSLMLGLVTDSRFFQNEGLRYTAHEAAAMLLRTGVDTAPILNTLNSGKAEADLRIQGFGLANFQLTCDGRLGHLTVKQSDLKKLGATVANLYASGLFNQFLAISHTVASVVIFEREDGMSACEFRSRGGIDVKEVAVSLGGGGHLAASGCSQTKDTDVLAAEAIELMRQQVEKFFSGQR